MTDINSHTDSKPGRNIFLIVLFILICAGVIGILVIMGSWLNKSQVPVLSIGQKVSNFTLTSFSGDAYRLSELSGKVVLVNVWASWCVSCDEEGYMLQEVWKELEPSGKVLFLGVDYVDTEKPALAYLKEHGITFPNGPDLASKISKLFRIQGVPESFLIGTDGILKAIKIGPFSSEDEIRDFVNLAME
jgi:cytochrome c biogenesis protein CcmG/thiol:disulfide interchange protein DsbE